ncbi:MAG: helix-turn-helix domain-containing protein [Gemmatimonadetes bacterium]|nr:helix-turn-helix domain-containing protein [Gemmatimonadota bacterium]
MREALRPLVLLHSDPAFRERLRRIAQGRFDLRRVQEWPELDAAVRATAPGGIVVVDPYHGRSPRDRLAPELISLLRRFPSAAVVAAPFMRPGWLEDIRILGEWGIAGIIDLEAESTDLLILRTLQGGRSRPLRNFLRDRFGALPTGRARLILDTAIEIVIAGHHARDLARELHVHRDTLLRWCRQARLPVPRQLLMWLRVLLAAELLDNPGQTVEHVALACGYSSDDALARALERRLGMRPAALRQHGAFRVAVERFQSEVRALYPPEEAPSAPHSPSMRVA